MMKAVLSDQIKIHACLAKGSNLNYSTEKWY